MRAELAGKTYNLILGTNAISEIEAQISRSYGFKMTIFEALEKPSIGDMRIILWGAMLASSPRITISQVGNIIDQHLESRTHDELSHMVIDLVGKAFPESDDIDPNTPDDGEGNETSPAH